MKRSIVVAFCGLLMLGLGPQDKDPLPEGFDGWDGATQRAWTKGVDAATKELKKEAAKRLNAAARALRESAAAGVDAQEAKKAVLEGMDAGFNAEEFKNLGQWVKAQRRSGLKGKELAGAIHGELAKRKAAKHAHKAAKAKGKPKRKHKGRGKP